MGQIFRTEAVVLRKMSFRETSQIVTLFTREKGKIAALAKGARKLKSQFGATLQPMSHIQAIFYYKPTRDLQTLSETSHITVLNGITSDLDKITAGMRMIELIQALLQQEESNPVVFNLLVNSLQHLDKASSHLENIWLHFQLQLAGALGFQPDINREEVESLADEGGILLLDSGSIHVARSADDFFSGGGKTSTPTSLVATRTALRAFAILARSDLEVITRLNLKPEIMIEVNNLVDRYLKFHFEDMLPTRSDRVIGQLKI
ncbi:MAG: DNA repair protein RecO [Rhodothermales bacterium]